jgi:hypothetical protein
MGVFCGITQYNGFNRKKTDVRNLEADLKFFRDTVSKVAENLFIELTVYFWKYD